MNFVSARHFLDNHGIAFEEDVLTTINSCGQKYVLRSILCADGVVYKEYLFHSNNSRYPSVQLACYQNKELSEEHEFSVIEEWF